MKLYVGIDLHSTNIYLAIINEEGGKIYGKRLNNDLDLILTELSNYKDDMVGIVIESTYNWYWLGDSLRENGYRVHLAIPAAIKSYSGIKYTNDKTDAYWLAELLRLNILKEGYIYPRDLRETRELLRRRVFLVKESTMNILCIQALILRYSNIRLSSNKIKRLNIEEVEKYLIGTQLQNAVCSHIKVLQELLRQISTIEKMLMKQMKESKLLKLLKTIPGIGNILGLTILLETGDINRFRRSGNYVSYCRTVGSKRESNEKKKGVNNRKNGNKYLSWAFLEAANFAIRYDQKIKKYYQRKLQKTHKIIAIKTVMHKLSRASYYIMKNEEEFNIEKAFG